MLSRLNFCWRGCLPPRRGGLDPRLVAGADLHRARNGSPVMASVVSNFATMALSFELE